MEDSDDASRGGVLDEVNGVREEARALTANDGLCEPKDRRSDELIGVAHAFEHAVHGQGEVVAESLALFFVPDGRREQVQLRGCIDAEGSHAFCARTLAAAARACAMESSSEMPRSG